MKKIFKNKYGFYDEKDFRNLKIDEMIKLMAVETSYQDVINIIRTQRAFTEEAKGPEGPEGQLKGPEGQLKGPS
jgi:hypothetical protein